MPSLPDRFSVTPEPAIAGDDLEICFDNPALARQTITIELDNGEGQAASVDITLDEEGHGCVTWIVPATGWDCIRMNQATSAERIMNQPSWDIDRILEEISLAYKEIDASGEWQQEAETVRNALEAISQKLSAKRYQPANHKCVLGVGGSGIVLRLEDSVFRLQDAALKFPRPIHGKVDFIAEMLEKEMKQLAMLRHPGVVRITYYVTLDGVKGYEKLPFYLMDAIDGAKSQTYAARAHAGALIDLISQSVQALVYLHNSNPLGLAHLDIKPDNYVVDKSGQPVIIDLGTCKAFGNDPVLTTVSCSTLYAHPKLAAKLEADPSSTDRHRGAMPRNEIVPEYDLWAIGVTILEWLGVSFHEGKIAPNAPLWKLGSYDRKYLLLLLSRLFTYNVPEFLCAELGLREPFIKALAITTAKQCSDILGRIDGIGCLDRMVPELCRGNSTGSIQAAQGQHLLTTPRVKIVLKHRLFRRLGSISQLGFVSQVYPGSKHTRREHSLGTFANAASMIRALWNDSASPLFRQIVTYQDCSDLLLCALLHDIGQFPLAHDLEEIDSKIFSHGEITAAMLKGLWSKRRPGARDIVFDELDEVFESWGTSHDRILAILRARPESTASTLKHKLLHCILSGPIDADKLDYLRRDGRQVGLPYCSGIDVDRLLGCLTTVVIRRVEGGISYVPVVGVSSKGRVAAEFMSFARYAMFSQVYWHHAVRSHKAMLSRSVLALLNCQKDDRAVFEFRSDFIEIVAGLPESLYSTFEGQMTFNDMKDGRDQEVIAALGEGTDLAATDAALLSWLRSRMRAKGLPEVELINGLLTRSLYKRLWILSAEAQPKMWRNVEDLWDKLDRKRRHQVGYELEKAIGKRLGQTAKSTMITSVEKDLKSIEVLIGGRKPWLLLDIPGKRSGSSVPLNSVLESYGRRIRKGNRVVGELQESSVWHKYAGDLRRSAGNIRVFCSPNLVDVIDGSVSSDHAWDDLLTVLEGLRP